MFRRKPRLILDVLSRRPGQWSSAKQVDVKVKYGLPRPGPDVQDGAVALLDVAFAGDLGSCEVAAPDNFSVRDLRFFQSRKMFFGDDQNVSRRLRADVFEGEHMLVLVNFLGGNLAANDAAEEAVSGSVSHGLLSLYRIKPVVKGLDEQAVLGF